mgnify:CR=1 FL=1
MRERYSHTLWKVKLEVKEKYDTTAPSYDELYGNEQYLKYEYIPRYAKPREGDVILDIGCGTGLFIEYLFYNNYNLTYYVGLDLSTVMLSIFKNRRRHLLPLIDLVQGDAEYPPFRPNSFNKIYLITVLDLLPQGVKVIEYIGELLKDNGLIIYSILKKYDDNRKLQYTSKCKDYIHVITKQKLTSTLKYLIHNHTHNEALKRY